MVRYARADGSKGSNKRVLEDATPWSEIVSQMNTKSVTEDEVEKKAKKAKKAEKAKKSDADRSTMLGGSEEQMEMKDDQSELPVEGCPETPDKKTSPSKSKKKRRSSKAVIERSQFVIENNQKYQILENGVKRPWFELPYEESERMTRYEGFWVKAETAKSLDELRESLKTTNDSDYVRKRMMKAKRKAHKDLTRELIYEQKHALEAEMSNVNEVKKSSENGVNDKKEKDDNVGKMDKKNGNKKTEEEIEVESVKFGGFWVTKEGAARLQKLQSDLVRRMVSKEQQRNIMKAERRKEEKVLRRLKTRVCLRCRKYGHMLSDCPEYDGEYGGEQNIFCYSCGSTEHKANDCPQGGTGNDFSHATCFVCRRVGHISRQCPDNPRGLYPNGGSCRGCGSVVHLAANCPLLKEEQEQSTIKLDLIDGNAVEALELTESQSKAWSEPAPFKKKSVRVVAF